MIEKWSSRYAQNIQGYGGYSIGKLFKMLRDPDIISLAGGLPSPDMFLKMQIREVSRKRLEEDLETIFQYTAIQGEIELLEACIAFLRRDRIRVNSEEIFITSGGQHGLDILGRCFLDPGDALVLDRPTFAGAITAFQMQRPEFLGVDIENDGSDIDAMRKMILGRPKSGAPKFIYVVPDFQNPTGITMSLEKRRALLDLSYETKIPVVEDSPYRDFRYYGTSIPSIYSLDQEREGGHVIGLYTFSKLFCPGIRVGFSIGPSDVIRAMMNIKEGNVLNTPKYNQDLCTAFLTRMDLDAHLQKCIAYYREKMDVFLETMTSHFPSDWGVTWTRPEGGLFLWVTVPERIDTKELFYEAVKFKVAFVPGEVFYGENPSNHHMRINFSYATKEQLAEAVKRLAECIQTQIK